MAKLQPKVRHYTTKGGLTLWRGIVYCEKCKPYLTKGRCNGHGGGLNGFKSEDECWAATWLKQSEMIQESSVTPSEEMTLNEVADHFFSRPRPKKISARMFRQYRRNWDAAIRDTTLGNKLVDEETPTPIDIDNWIGALASGTTSRSGKPLSASTLHAYRTTLVRCGLKHAISPLGRRKDNPAANLDLPASLAEPRDPIREFTPKEVIVLAAAIPEDRPYRLLVFLGARYGFRIGELFAIRRDDLEELEDGRFVIHVNAQIQDGERIPPKTAAGIRSVTIDVDLSATIFAHLIKFPTEDNLNGVLFPSPKGSYLHYSNFVRRVWNPALEKAGIPHCGTHSMRHSAVKMMKKSGLPIHLIGKIVGQADLSVTLNSYGVGVDPEDFDAASEAVGAIWKVKAPVTSVPEEAPNTAKITIPVASSVASIEESADALIAAYGNSSMD